MARTNFKYEKRQKELAKQAKAEEKRLRKLEKRNLADGEGVSDGTGGLESDDSFTGDETSVSNPPGEG